MKASLVTMIVLLAVWPVAAHDWRRHEDPQFANLKGLTPAEVAILAEEEIAAREMAAAAPVLFQPAGGPTTAPLLAREENRPPLRSQDELILDLKGGDPSLEPVAGFGRFKAQFRDQITLFSAVRRSRSPDNSASQHSSCQIGITCSVLCH